MWSGAWQLFALLLTLLSPTSPSTVSPPRVPAGRLARKVVERQAVNTHLHVGEPLDSRANIFGVATDLFELRYDEQVTSSFSKSLLFAS